MYVKFVHLLLMVLINKLLEKVDSFYLNLGFMLKRLKIPRLKSIIIPTDLHNDDKKKINNYITGWVQRYIHVWNVYIYKRKLRYK